MRAIDADALTEDCKRYLGTLNPDKDGKECTRIQWLIGVIENAPTIEPEPCEAGAQMSLPECEDVPDINVWKLDGDALDEAIRFEERAAEAYSEAHNQFHDNVDPADAECCLNRAARHRQLASWLRELKRMRAQGTCDDAVSREIACQKMIDLYEEDYESYGVECFDCYRAIDVLRKLPSVTPKQIDYKTDHGYMWICPDCGLVVHSDFEKCVRCGHKREE